MARDTKQTQSSIRQITKALREEEKKTRERLRKSRESAGQRFPLLFTMLGAFGLVSTFYGFEHIIDQIPPLKQNPEYMLATGVILLITTGTLYKKLG